MDRRQKKTREAIFSAFGELISKKRYENITVGEIIAKANVGRSTFYSHFETKDSLLYAMCSDIFDHIFEGEDCGYTDESEGLEQTLSHILFHLYEQRNTIVRLLRSDSKELFMQYMNRYTRALFEANCGLFASKVPVDFLIDYLTGAFANTVLWWVNKNMDGTPREVAGYFLSVIEKH